MTQEEFKTFIEDNEKVLNDCYEKMKEAKTEYIHEHAKFKRMDKVTVLVYKEHQHPFQKDKILPEKKVTCFIDKVRVHNNGHIQYEFNKMKKDGTVSLNSEYINNYVSIELAN